MNRLTGVRWDTKPNISMYGTDWMVKKGHILIFLLLTEYVRHQVQAVNLLGIRGQAGKLKTMKPHCSSDKV